MLATANENSTTESAKRLEPLFREYQLTKRERQIAQLVVVGGMPSQQAAKELWLTRHTIKFHLRNIYRKLKVSSRADAAARLTT